MMALDKLGPRIVIIGPSCSGKSTLAFRLSNKLSIPCLHLDQIAHEPNMNWQRRPDKVFVQDHDAFIKQDSWVIEGCYSVCMPQRLKRATAIIWLDPKPIGFLWRYISRCLGLSGNRYGAVENANNLFNYDLVRHTLLQYPKNRMRYQRFIDEAAMTENVINIRSMRDLKALSAMWNLF